MKRFIFLSLMLVTLLPVISVNAAEPPASRCYEMRTYYAIEGKLDALNARFRDHTTELFSRHGMTNIGYWMPLENPERRLIYLLSYPDQAARESSWKAFQADPDWIAAKAASENAGLLVAKIESRFLTTTDFSPEIKMASDAGPHTFELRTYTTTPGNLPNLLKRFRDHTVELFSKHGMRHFVYFTPSVGQAGADDTLLYFIYHASPDARQASFAAFVSDPEWIKVKAASEVNGPLTVPGGVKFELLKPTDYSPAK